MNFDQVISHHVQRAIISRLIAAETVRYADLKPNDIESNLFMYHLRQLIKAGYVQKGDGGYSLTLQGGQYVNRMSLDNQHIRIQPKVITILVITHHDGEMLLLERLHQPFLHFKGLPSGKLHFGEPLETAASRELSEKAGLTNVPLTLRGTIILRVVSKDAQPVVVSHTIGYVFSGSYGGEKSVKQTAHFRSFWADSTELLTGRRFFAHPEILELLKQQELFTKSFDFVSDI